MGIDIVYAIVILLAAVYGFRKGILHSVISLVAFVTGILAAVHLSEITAEFIDTKLHVSSKYLPIISFVILFLGVFLLFRLLEHLLENVFKMIHLNFLNKTAGALIWVIVATMIFSTLLFYINNMKLLSEKIKSESIVYEQIEGLTPKTAELIGKIIPPVKNIFNSLQDWFQKQELKNIPQTNEAVTVS